VNPARVPSGDGPTPAFDPQPPRNPPSPQPGPPCESPRSCPPRSRLPPESLSSSGSPQPGRPRCESPRSSPSSRPSARVTAQLATNRSRPPAPGCREARTLAAGPRSQRPRSSGGPRDAGVVGSVPSPTQPQFGRISAHGRIPAHGRDLDRRRCVHLSGGTPGQGARRIPAPSASHRRAPHTPEAHRAPRGARSAEKAAHAPADFALHRRRHHSARRVPALGRAGGERPAAAQARGPGGAPVTARAPSIRPAAASGSGPSESCATAAAGPGPSES
jgi:hypothetical protein